MLETKRFEDGCIKRIHVNQHIIRSNRTHNLDDPPISVKHKNITYPATSVVVSGECRVIYEPNNPLSCGARVWIETNSPIEIN